VYLILHNLHKNRRIFEQALVFDFGEFAMDSREILNEGANTSNPADPNYINQKLINIQGNATNRLISTEQFESPAIFGGTAQE
jgi:hypothetical protein